MKNLFHNSFRQSNASLLKPGSYSVGLVSIRPAPSRDFGDGNPPRDRITFCFKTTKNDECINRTLTASTDSRSRLLEFVRQLAGHNLPTEEQLKDGEKLTEYLNSFIGKKFTASIVPSKNGRFNDIVSITSSRQLGEAA